MFIVPEKTCPRAEKANRSETLGQPYSFTRTRFVRTIETGKGNQINTPFG